MNSATPPPSLGTRAQSPHKTSRVRDLGEVSHLERSFAEGNLGEMEYWIQSGVVEQAMAGKTRSRRDYGVVLMDRLSRKLSDIDTLGTDDLNRFNAVLDTLWDLGAIGKIDHHALWLRRLAAFDIADRLVALGHHPGWGREVGDNEQVRGREPGNRSALEQLFCMMVRRQDSRYGALGRNAQTSIPPAWVARAQRFLAMEGHDPYALNQALGWVAKGDCGKRTNSKTPWGQWRDCLIALGANAMMVEGDALDMLAHMAPTRSLLADDVWAELRLRLRHDKGQHPGKPSEALVREVLHEQVGKRALRWTKFANSWLEALERVHPNDGHTALDRPVSDTEQAVLNHHCWRYSQPSQHPENWARLLDAPNGVEIARRVARGLQKRGQLMPWSPQPTDQAGSWYRSFPDAKELICINNSLSARRLACLAQVLSDEVVREGVDDQWRTRSADAAMLYDSMGDSRSDPPPSLEFELGRTMRWIKPMPLVGVSRKSNRAVEELDGLLAVAGPRVLRNPSAECTWTHRTLQGMPEYWHETSTPEDVKRAYVASLDKWGALDALAQVAQELNDLPGTKDQVGVEIHNLSTDLCYDWYSGWIRHGSDQMLLAEHFSDQPAIAQGIRRLAVLCWVRGLYLVHEEMEQHASEEAPGWVKTCCQQDPALLELAEQAVLHGLEKITSTSRNGQQSKAAWSLHRLVSMGWASNNPQTCLEVLGRAMVNGPEMVSESILGVLPNLVRSLTGNPNWAEGVFIHTLCTHRLTQGLAINQWVQYCQEGVERGAEFLLDLSERNNALADAVGIALDRRNLARLAQTQQAGHEPQRRKM